MADDVWRRRGAGEDDDFGPPLFGEESTGEVRDQSGGLSFGASDTGQLPHWTEPPTGEMPRTLATPVVDPGGEPDVWSTFSHESPIWSDDPGVDDTGGARRPEPDTGEIGGHVTGEVSGALPRREPGRITIGTDPTDDRTGRPMPRSRSRAGRDDPGARPGRPGAPGTASGVRTGGTAGRDMPTAIAVGLLIAAAFIGAVLVGPWAVLVVVMVVVGLASIEFFDKVSEKGYRPATIVGIFGCVLAPLAAYHEGERALPLVIVLALAGGCATFVSASGVESNPMPNMAITMLGITWIGILGAYAAVIVRFSNFGDNPIGTDTLLLLALGVVANDIGALFVGSIAGRTPLRSWISPNKSLEGLVGGTVATVGVMVLVGVADRSDTWNSTGDLIILGLVIAVMAPLGDFTESMFKRNLDVKDFGSIVRGHGGVLDRFDGFLFTLPAVYYLLLVLEPYAS